MEISAPPCLDFQIHGEWDGEAAPLPSLVLDPLQYLLFVCLNISFIVDKLSLFMHTPFSCH